MGASEEVLVPFPGPVRSLPPVTRCRSTLLIASVQALRERGHFERYRALLDPRFHDVVLPAIAGVWLPIEAGIAHYRAADALALTPLEQAAMGVAISERLGSSVFGTIATLAKSSGVTPWTGLRHFQRFFDRFFDGGGTCVVKVGPKDARIEVVGLPLAAIPYFVTAYRGLVQALASMFSHALYVTTIPRLAGPTTLGFRVAWV